MQNLDALEISNIRRSCEMLSALGIVEPVIVDVGANQGAVTQLFLESIPGAFLHAVEPNQQLAEMMSTRFGAQGLLGRRVEVYAVALGSSDGELELNVFNDSTTSSLLDVDERLALVSSNFELASIEKVQVQTLDVLCDEMSKHGSAPAFVKIDTQGYELKVLQGAQRLLGQTPPALIQVEMIVASNYIGQAHFDEVWGFLRRFGYRLYDFERLVHTSRGNLYFGEALFLSDAAWSQLGFL